MLNVTIRSARRLILDGWVSSVRLPGAAGEFEVLGFHVPFVATLKTGRVWVDRPVPVPGGPGSIEPGTPGTGTGRQMLLVRGGLAWLASERLMVVVEDMTPRGAR
ncbi:MAG: hypothetical protein HY600_03680 [Candidatus Omnitrophica bacterium]|nr:hypothetical protein [Candidatus Omnitrophota bacterium]